MQINTPERTIVTVSSILCQTIIEFIHKAANIISLPTWSSVSACCASQCQFVNGVDVVVTVVVETLRVI